LALRTATNRDEPEPLDWDGFADFLLSGQQYE